MSLIVDIAQFAPKINLKVDSIFKYKYNVYAIVSGIGRPAAYPAMEG